MSSTTMDLRAQATALYTPEYRASIFEPPPPPPGIKANYNGPNSAGMFYIAFTVIAYLLSFTFTATRVYTKTFLTRSLGWDDYTCVTAACFLFVWTVSSIRMATLGMGRYGWNVRLTVAQNEDYQKMNFISSSVYACALALIKISILAMYLRTFTAKGKFRKTLWIVLGIVIVTSIVVIPLYWMTISPLECEWKYITLDFDLWTQFCHTRYSDTPYWLFMAALSIVLDIIVITLPCRAVWKLHMVKRQKIVVVLMMSAGGVVTMATIVRFVYFYRDIYVGTSEAGFAGTYANFQIFLLSTLELNLAIICACLPSLKSFTRKYVPCLLKLPPTDNRGLSNGRSSKRPTLPHSSRIGLTGSGQAGKDEIADGSYLELGDAKSDQSYAMTSKLVDSHSTFLRTT